MSGPGQIVPGIRRNEKDRMKTHRLDLQVNTWVDVMEIRQPQDIQEFRKVLQERDGRDQSNLLLCRNITVLWPPSWEEEWTVDDILTLAERRLGRPGRHVQLAVREKIPRKTTEASRTKNAATWSFPLWSNTLTN